MTGVTTLAAADGATAPSPEKPVSPTRRLPKIVKLQPTFRHPYKCTLKAHANYDKRKHGRLVLNLYTKK